MEGWSRKVRPAIDNSTAWNMRPGSGASRGALPFMGMIGFDIA
jgi:hypothetical protein